MNKYSLLLWDRQPLSPAERGQALREKAANKMLALKPLGLQMNIADERATTPSPAPKPLFSEPFVAQINLWLADESELAAHGDILRAQGFQLAVYRVDEWLYTDYGEHPVANAPRDWPDGQRSPGILAVTIIRKPKRLDRQEWMRRWFAWQSPMSEWMQPRARYVRNLVQEPLSPGAEAIDGLVEEAWPSSEHVTNKRLFYGADNAWQLLRNMAIMLHSVLRILNIFNITTVMLSEYFILSPKAEDVTKR